MLGASFDTGNLGVSALAWSSLKLIRTKWPMARITLVGGGRRPTVTKVRLNGQSEPFWTWPVRYSPNILVRNHILGLLLLVALCRYFPTLRQRLAPNESTLGVLLRGDLFCDITGGDSFSDIYGFKRFRRSLLRKYICQMTGKPFILLPQTYGPFTSKLSGVLASRVLNNASMIYARDRQGVGIVWELIGPAAPVKLCPDVAFILNAYRPDTALVRQLEAFRAAGTKLLGLNISGLLHSGGYTQANMFGLACDYPALIKDLLNMFCKMPDWQVVLVPHVLPMADYAVEDDLVAAENALAELSPELQTRVLVLERGYDQNETKYCIGLCDFFIGSRMHATIAALSQGIPSIGLAYSPKFAGVFETAGMADCVLDLRTMNMRQVIQEVRSIFANRKAISEVLSRTIPQVQSQLMTMFDVIDDLLGG